MENNYVRIFDTTLRDGEQSPGATMTSAEKMEVARTNLQNMVFRYIELVGYGKQMTLAEASAMKLYAAQTCMEVTTEAVQIFGGMGYMREARVEQLMRDSKILQIYAGTDEMQVIAIAKDLLSR